MPRLPRFPRTALAPWVLGACVLPGGFHAQEAGTAAAPAARLRSLELEGREWIPLDAYLRAARLEIGKAWTAEAEERAFAGLLGMEFLAEVSPPRVERDAEGNVDVTFRVRELALVRSVEIEGSTAVPEDDLRKGLLTRPGRPLRPADLEADREAMLEKCEREGFLLASIEAEVTEIATGRVAVAFRIDEGERAGLAEVEVRGNQSISTSEVLRAAGLRPRRLFGVLEKGYLDPRALAAGLRAVRDLYRRRGFLDVQVDLESVELDPSFREVTVAITIDEGLRYRLERVEIEGNEVFGEALLLPQLDLETGVHLSEEALLAARRRLVDLYQKRSDRVPRIATRLIYAEEGDGVTAVFDVDEREHFFVGEVEVRGNWRTLDRVIRARSEALPGEPLTLFALEDTARRMKSLGIFDDVQVETQPTERRDARDVVITVEEAERIGRWEVGGGASSGEGGVGYFHVEHPNVDIFRLPRSWTDWKGAFQGGGQSLAIDVIPGSVESEYRFRFLEPYLYSTRNALALQVGGFLYDRGPYDEDRLRAGVEVRRLLGSDERLSAGLGYWLEEVEIEDLEADAPPTVFRDRGDTTIVFPRLSLHWSDLDVNPYSGPRGALAELAGDLATGASGSEVDFARLEASADLFQCFFDRDPDLRHTLQVGLESGWIEGLGEERVPFFEHFFLGGPRSFRGFEYRGLGPHEAREPIGGRAMLHGTVKYSAPLFLREVRAVAIFDWGLLEEDFGEFSTARVRTAGGGGIELRVRVPLFDRVVPVNLYFVQALSSEAGDEEQLFSFTLGYGF